MLNDEAITNLWCIAPVYPELVPLVIYIPFEDKPHLSVYLAKKENFNENEMCLLTIEKNDK